LLIEVFEFSSGVAQEELALDPDSEAQDIGKEQPAVESDLLAVTVNEQKTPGNEKAEFASQPDSKREKDQCGNKNCIGQHVFPFCRYARCGANRQNKSGEPYSSPLEKRSGAIALFYPDRRMVYLANLKGLNLVAGAFPVETLAFDHYGQIIFGEMQFAFNFDEVAFFQYFRVAAEVRARTDDAMPFNAGKPLVSFDSPNAGGNAELQQSDGVSRDSIGLGNVSITAQEAAQLDDIFKEFHIHDSSLRRTCRLRGIVLGNGIGIEVLFALLCRTRQFLERCGPYLP